MLLFVDCSASMRRDSIGCTMLLFVDCSASMGGRALGVQCCCLLTVVLHEEGEHRVYNVVVC